MQLIKKFLTDDDETLKEIGAVILLKIRFMTKQDSKDYPKTKIWPQLIPLREFIFFNIDGTKG